jgi:hypothetical protein
MVQDELIESQRKRQEAGKPALFKTDKLTIEAHCVFAKKSSENAGMGFRLLSLVDVNGGIHHGVENSFVQKITLELKVADSNDNSFSLIGESAGFLPKRIAKKGDT